MKFWLGLAGDASLDYVGDEFALLHGDGGDAGEWLTCLMGVVDDITDCEDVLV